MSGKGISLSSLEAHEDHGMFLMAGKEKNPRKAWRNIQGMTGRSA